jgi:hypothetical protein
MRTLLLPLMLMGCALGPTGWEGPEVALPQARHGFAVPVDAFSWYRPTDDPETACSVGEPRRRGAVEPVVLTASDRVYWMGEPVVSLVDGRIADADLRGLLVPALFDVVFKRVSQEKQLRSICGATDRPLQAALALDASLPAETLSQLLYTLGQAAVGDPILLVRGDPRERPSTAPDAMRMTVAVSSGGYTLTAGGETREVTALPQHLGADAPAGATLLLARHLPHGAVITALDDLAEAGVYCVIPAMPDKADPPREAVPTTQKRAPLVIPRTGTVTAHLLSLPGFGMGEMPPRVDGIACPVHRFAIEAKRAAPAPGSVLDALGSGASGLGGLLDGP